MWGGIRKNNRGGWVFIITLLLYWGYTVTFIKALTLCHNWIHPIHHFPLSPSPILGIVSTGLIFHFHTWVHIFHHIHPPTLFLYILPLRTDANTQPGPVLPSCLEGVNLINVCYLHGWKYHNETLLYNKYTNTKLRNAKKQSLVDTSQP
jgi:hypothetical protein